MLITDDVAACLILLRLRFDHCLPCGIHLRSLARPRSDIFEQLKLARKDRDIDAQHRQNLTSIGALLQCYSTHSGV